MSTTTSIPIAIFGTNPDIAQAIRTHMLPEYDVVHISLTLPTALTELPQVCTATESSSMTEFPSPSSSLGTNASLPPSQRRAARAVIFGRGISDEDAAKVEDAVEAKCGKGVRMVKVGGGGPPSHGKPDVEGLVKGLKKELEGV